MKESKLINKVEHNDTISPSFIKRSFIYFVILLLIQSLIAYGSILVFDTLPESVTGMPKDHVIQRQLQTGAVNLIRLQIKEHPEITPQQTLEQLQPLFDYELMLTPKKTHLSKIVRESLKNHGIAFDEEENFIYATFDENSLLKLGPLISTDILDANVMSFWIYLILWSILSSVIFFVIFYFAFAHFWRDTVNIRHTAEELTHGNLKARVKPAQTWLFKPLSSALNTMAAQIEQLVSTNQTMSHAMAHELRTPLSRIRFELSMMEEAQNQQEISSYIGGIKQDVDELEALINISLNFFKLQQNKIELNLTTVNMHQWIDKLCASLSVLKPENFIFTYECDDFVYQIDTRLTDVIIKNLVMNAFKYANSKAILHVYQKESELFIEVDDDGPGVSPSERNRVFIPFSRLDTSRTRSTGGYGLGLAYVKLIAEAHNGSVFVATSELGGARFVVILNTTES